MKYLSQIDIAPQGGFKGLGQSELGNPTGTGIEGFTKFISSTIGLMTIIAIIWFVFNFIIGAIGIISAGGDKAALESSRKKIVSSITGLVIVVAAIFVIRLVGFLLGIPNILNLNQLFCQIQGQTCL